MHSNSLVALFLASALLLGTARASDGPSIDFARDVRPILEANCYSCHGPTKQKAGLRLDRRDSAHKVLAAGKPDESDLLQRITAQEDDERMPRDAAPLSAAQIETLRAWITAGASWPDDASAAATRSEHWSYQPIKRTEPPRLADERGVRNDVDRFVRARLEREKLAPSPEADRVTLARRVALDLTGLPPSLEDLDAFLGDKSSDAYERFVDRALASPAYAERRAQWWLDLARYADTNGYEKDERRTAWRWRDWVIAAFAANMPFDRFTIEQLAGDLLPNATLDQRIATGFHRNTLVNQEGGTDPEEFRAAAVIDRVNTTAAVWLASTVQCTQCHNHKFDPFSQREFYQFFAFFNETADSGNALGPEIPAPTRAQSAEVARLRARQTDLEYQLAADDAALDLEESTWRDRIRAALPPVPAWTTFVPSTATSDAATKLDVRADGSVLASGATPDQETYTFSGATSLVHIGLVRIAALLDPSLPTDGPGRAPNGNFVLTDVAIELVNGETVTRIETSEAIADYEQTYGGSFQAALAIDADPATGWAIDRGKNDTRAQELVIVPRAAFVVPAGAQLRVKLAFKSPFAQHSLGALRISVTDGAYLPRDVRPPREIEALLRRDERAWTSDERALVTRHWRRTQSTPGRALAAVEKQLADLQASIPTTLVMQALDKPRTSRMFTKGSYLSPGDVVEPDVPSVLPPLPADVKPDRLALARWLVSRDNPLTARVIVNRVWEQLFGRGIVATIDDFGTRGDAPSHPELLDHLALELVDNGWNLKQLFKTIVTSATYRQSSDVDREHEERDPDNVLLARAPRPRLECETLRDAALAASGLLVRTVGGPSVMPPQPDGVWAPVYSGDAWMPAMDNERFRRGLYTFWRRGSPYATFTLFDAPSRELTCTRRPRTDTPLQALALLDDPAFVECAAALARRMLVETGDQDRARIERGFRLCTSRAPGDEDVATLERLLRDERVRYKSSPADASKLIAAVAPALRGAKIDDEAELAAWTSVANVLLNLDEFVTRN